MDLSKHIEQDFELMVSMLQDMQEELKVHDEKEQIGFYTPLKRLIYEANSELIKFNRDEGLKNRSNRWELLYNTIFKIDTN